MFTFITSIRHPRNSFFYERVWDLLRDTLFSVCSQTCTEFKVIVVCNELLDDFSDNPVINGNVDFVTVDFEPPSLSVGATTGVTACNLDRGIKFVVGLLAAKKYNPEYVMFVDADDFVSDGIVEYCAANSGKHGWTFTRGAYVQDYRTTNRLNFNQTCGTSHILNYNILTQDIPFDRLTTESTASDIKRYVHPFFIKGVLGCHMNYGVYFFNCYGSLEEWPLSESAAYNMGTGENHSGKLSKCGAGWNEFRRASSRRLDRAVYRYKFPLVDHKRKLIPIYTGDASCKRAIIDLGLYNPVELSGEEVRSIYGGVICNQYTSFTFVRNPWERLVNEYHIHYTGRGVSQTFSEFVRSCDLPTQSSTLPNWLTEFIKLEELVSNTGLDLTGVSKLDKFYRGDYTDYYDDSLKSYVAEKYSTDIQRFGYTFDASVNLPSVPVIDNLYPTNLTLSAIILPRIEVFFLEEWIDHHLALGFEKVLLYDNGTISIDNSIWSQGARSLEVHESYKWKKKPDIPYFEEFSDEQILDKLSEIVTKYNGVVELIPWVYGKDHNREYPYSQWDTIRHSCLNNPNSWFFFADPDEYLVLRLHNTVQDLIMDHPDVSCFSFGQRIFDARKAFEPVREIYNWGYENPMHKNLIVSDVDLEREDLTVHMQRPNYGKTYRVPRDKAMYYHYRGSPDLSGGTTVGNKLGNPGITFDKLDYSMKNYML